jgi:hypothetical protein
MKATLRLTSARTRSGRSKQRLHATMAPQSCPTTNTLTANTNTSIKARPSREPNKSEYPDLREPEVVEERDEVPDDVEDGVGGRVLRRGGPSVAAEVGRDAAVAARRQVPHLVAPRGPQLREAVHEQHGWRGGGRRAGLGDVHRDAVDLHLPVPHRRLRHGVTVAATTGSTCRVVLRT